MTASSGSTGSEIPPADAARLVANGPFGYVSSSATGTIERVNATLLEWLGFELADLCGERTVQGLLAPGDRIYYDTHIRPLLHMGGSAREIAVEFVRRDGTRLPTLINTHLVGQDPGAIGERRIETIVIDATMRRTYEQELLQERQAAERSAARLRFMYDVVSGLATASTVDEVRAVVSEAAAGPFLGVRCGLWLFGPDRRSAVRSGTEDSPGRTEVVFDEEERGDAIALLTAGNLVVVEDLDAAQQRFPLLTKWLRESHMRSAVVAPLIENSQLFGVLSLGFAEVHRFDSDEQRAVASLAVQTEQALSRIWLHEAQLRSRARLERLHAFSRSLAGGTALDPVIEAIRRGGHEILGAADVRVALLDEATSSLVFVGGTVGSAAPAIRIPLDRRSIAAAAVNRGSIVQVETRDQLVAVYPASPILTDTALHRVLAAPRGAPVAT